MLKKLISPWLVSSEEDPISARQQVLLNLVLLALAGPGLLYGLVMAAMWALGRAPIIGALAGLGVQPFYLLAYWLGRRGRVRLAGYMPTIVLFLGMAVVNYQLGVGHGILIGYAIVSLTAGILIGTGAALFFALLSVSIHLAVGAAQAAGRLLAPLPPETTVVADGVAMGLGLAVLVIFNWFSNRESNRMLRREQELIVELRVHRTELERRVVERTAELTKANEQLENEITERKRAEETLKESEARFRDLVLSTSDWVWEVDSQGRYTYCSGRVVDVLGYSVEEMLGKTPFDLMPPDEATRVARIFEAIVGNREPIVDLENWNIDREGRQVCLLTNGAPMFDREGHFIGYRGVDKDITERKRTGVQIELLNRLKEDLLSFRNLDEKLERITDGVVEIFEADFCRIWITKSGDRCDSGCIHAEVTEGPHVCRHRDRCLHLVVSSGRYTHTDGEVHRRVPFGCYKIGRVAAGEDPKFVTTDVTHDPRVHDHDWAEELGLVSFAGYRLLLETGEPLGVLALFSKQVISPDVDALLEGLANTTAQVIQTARAEEALWASERRLRAIVEGIQAFMVNVDTYGHFTFVNEAVARIVGYDSPEELVGKQYLNFIHPKDRNRVRDFYLNQVSTGQESALIEFRIAAADGKARWFSFLSNLIVQDGQIVGQAGIGQDITERKQAEGALSESHERFLTVLDSIDAHIYAADMETYEILYMNRHMRDDFGDGLVGKSCWQEFCGALGPCAHCTNDKLLDADGNPTGVCVWEGQNPITDKWYENHDQAVEWVDGRLVRLQVATDITERKQGEARLAAVRSLGQKLVLSRDTAEIAQLVVDAAQQVLNFPVCGLWLVDEEQQVLVRRAHTAGPEALEAPPLALDGERGITVSVVRSREPIYLPDVSQDPRYVDGGFVSCSELGIPLKVGDLVVGVLNTESDQLDAFSPADAQLLEALASTAAIALENARLYETVQRELAERKRAETERERLLAAEHEQRLQAETLREVSSALNTSLDREQVLRLILEQLAQVVDSDSTAVMLVSGNMLEIVAQRGFSSEEQQLARLQIGVLPHVQEVIDSRTPVIIPDTAAAPGWLHRPASGHIRCWLGVPLVAQDRVIGLLNLDKKQPGFYTQRDADLAVAFANQAAVAIENARLYETVQRELAEREQAEKETRRLKEFNESIVQNTFEGIVVEDAEGCFSFVNPAAATMLGYAPDELLGQPLTIAVPPSQQHIVQAAHERRARGEADQYELELMRKNGTRLPILISGSPRFDADTGRFAGTLTVFADITERKRTEEETQRRATQAALIYKVGQRVSGELELEALLSEIVGAIREAFDYDNVMMMVLDEEKEHLILQSVAGDYADAFADGLRLAIGEGMIGHAVATGETQASGDVSQNPHYVRKEQEATQSELVVPIKSGEKVIGALDLQSEEFNAFDESDVVAMETLSTQIATAINNARLFEETQLRMTQLTLISDIGEKIAAVLDMESLLERATRLVQESFGYHHVAIFTMDREQDELIMRARSGDLAHLYSLDHRLSLGQGMVGRAGHHNETLLANNVDADPRYVNLYPDVVQTRSELSVPIGVGGEVMGVLDVQSLQLDAFDENDVMVIETVARQVAVALENALLHGKILGHAEQLEQRVQERTNDLERRSVQLRVAAEIARDATSARELNDLLNSAVNLVRDRFGFYHAGIFLLDKRREYAILKAATGKAGRQMIERKHKLKVGETGIVGYATGTGQPRIALDVGADAVHFKNPLLPETRSEMALPFKVNDQVIGALDVQSTQEAAFDEEDVAILQTMADQLAVAITRLERAAELEVQHARLDATLRSTADGIVVADEEGNVIQANPVAQTWLTQTLAPEEAERLRGTIRSAVVQTKGQTVELLELTGLDLEVKAAPISEPGLDEAAAVVAIHDVSHLKSLDRMKTRFITNISHELRTPITTIKLYAYLMQQKSEKWEHYLSVLAQEADRQARLVEDILEISHIDSGRLEMKPRPTSLDELTGSVVASHHALAQERGLSLEHLLAGTDTVALADPGRIAQVLNNLVGNAIRYTSEGGRVTVSTGEQEAEGRAWATVTVADTGMGIPEKELPYIFDRFFRGEKPRAMQLTGTGLGLSIVEEIVELHGGRMTVESEEGAGSTFTVWLPLAD